MRALPCCGRTPPHICAGTEWAHPSHIGAGTRRAMGQALGKVKAVGVSNYTIEDLEELVSTPEYPPMLVSTPEYPSRSS